MSLPYHELKSALLWIYQTRWKRPVFFVIYYRDITLVLLLKEQVVVALQRKLQHGNQKIIPNLDPGQGKDVLVKVQWSAADL